MKKVIVIAMLITVLAALLIGGGVCLADDDSQPTYYYVDKGVELTVRSSALQNASVVMQIPATYAFECIETLDDFVKIRYNSYEGYISKSELIAYCKPVTSKWGDNAYFYSITLTTSSNIKTERVTLYDMDINPYEDTLSKTSVTINKVYGYYHGDNGYYFLVDVTTSVFGSTNNTTGYIKASDTTYDSFSKDTIAVSAGYAEETKVVEQPAPSGDADSVITDGNGDPSNPSVPATNNFERYLLIAVIAVLCVVIIILIFVPNKGRRKQ